MNLLWTAKDLKTSGLTVIKHEISHVLLNKLLPEISVSNPLKLLAHIVIDEGIAHFIGFPKDPKALFAKYADKWIAAEKNLEISQTKLLNRELPLAEKELIIKTADTGAYWNKYASIAGMFRAAKIFELSGAPALRKCIRAGVLPKQN